MASERVVNATVSDGRQLLMDGHLPNSSQSLVTLGNNTNNRLESSWKHLNDTMSSFMGLDECLASIICYQARCEQSFEAQVNKISVVQNSTYDREMSLLANLVSQHACELIFEQYTYIKSEKGQYEFYEEIPGIIFIKNISEEDESLDEPKAEYSVNKEGWDCSCLFMSTRLLPCRPPLGTPLGNRDPDSAIAI
ncbi:unnamed protein product [Phytophthora fragariaefolia]|uniref:Unnamed protein product n=1 Tax=Phytophthora fragariaefolia TaxID=1490495 RepID=A0A9W6XRL8_9STRA|nr:unnamed protein product [Phytophthora fragariaefolia]